jgi:hypothetical protein
MTDGGKKLTVLQRAQAAQAFDTSDHADALARAQSAWDAAVAKLPQGGAARCRVALALAPLRHDLDLAAECATFANTLPAEAPLRRSYLALAATAK